MVVVVISNNCGRRRCQGSCASGRRRRRQRRASSSSTRSEVVVVVGTAAAIVSSAIRGEGSGQWSCGDRLAIGRGRCCHQQRLWSSSAPTGVVGAVKKAGVIIIDAVGDCFPSPLAAAVVGSAIRGEGVRPMVMRRSSSSKLGRGAHRSRAGRVTGSE